MMREGKDHITEVFIPICAATLTSAQGSDIAEGIYTFHQIENSRWGW